MRLVFIEMNYFSLLLISVDDSLNLPLHRPHFWCTYFDIKYKVVVAVCYNLMIWTTALKVSEEIGRPLYVVENKVSDHQISESNRLYATNYKWNKKVWALTNA